MSADVDAAREHAERAVTVGEASELAPAVLAGARFVLARAMSSDRTMRARASSLAEQARDAYAELGDVGKGDVAEVEAWISEHSLP